MENQKNQSQRPNRQGVNNPMYGRHHTDETKRKQSEAARQRAADYQKLKDSQHHITMDEFLSNNPSVKEYIKLLAKTVIREEIDKMLWRKKQSAK